MDTESCREKIMSQEYWDFIAPSYRKPEEISETLGCKMELDYKFDIIYADSSLLEPLSIERYWYNSIPNCYALLNMQALNEAGITAVQNYPALGLMGEGVMIGFLDTGIDYQNPVFCYLDGTTRITGIWDQTIQTGTAPEGLVYGSEYTQERINEALRSEHPLDIVPSEDANGHGTYLASVAAGSADVESHFLGAAPESAIAVVKLKEAKEYLKEFYGIQRNAVCFQENDIMAGCTYLNRLAEERGMPLVICIALGTNFGGHNSTSLLSGMLTLYASTLNRYIIIGGGNEANQRHHYRNVLSSMQDRREVEIRVGNGIGGFVTEVWTTVPNVITISLVSPSGERTPPISIRQGSRYTYNFTFERTSITAEYRLLVQNNDSQLIFLKFSDPAEGLWKIVVEPIQVSDGVFHIWLPIQEFLSGEVYFLEADPGNTITEPSTSVNGMTVAYYNAVDNSIDINSGRGYTRNNVIKPDFAAPGVQVTGAELNGRFVSRTGSSAAAAITAGAAALLVEWFAGQQDFQGVSASQIRTLLVLGADQKPLLSYPNPEWGYGTLNVYQALDQLRRL